MLVGLLVRLDLIGHDDTIYKSYRVQVFHSSYYFFIAPSLLFPGVEDSVRVPVEWDSSMRGTILFAQLTYDSSHVDNIGK